MIRSIRASDARFRSLALEPGFNLVVAERADEASAIDSTNGLGKTSLIQLMHFALGAAGTGKPTPVPFVEALSGWTFYFTLMVDGHEVELERCTTTPNEVRLTGAPDAWSTYGTKKDSVLTLKINAWRKLLGRTVYGLTGEPDEPTFRTLIASSIRYEDNHFSDLIAVHSRTTNAKKAIVGAWLLGLPWELTAKHDRVKRAQKKSRRPDNGKRSSELLAEEARLVASIDLLTQEQAAFGIAQQASLTIERVEVLSREINTLNDALYSAKTALADYRESLETLNTNVPEVDIAALYNEAKAWLPTKVSARLQEVHQFHKTLIANRAEFLATEMTALERQVDENQRRVLALDLERRPLVAALASESVVEQYIALGRSILREESELERVRQELTDIRELQAQKDSFVDQQAAIQKQMRLAHEEHAKQRSYAQQLFSRFMAQAFHEKSVLIIDDESPTFTYRADVPSIGSGGVQQMAVACFDLVVARLLHERGIGPNLLVHDSRMFAHMDPRQRAGILFTAHKEASKLGYTYVALMNEHELADAREEIHTFDPDSYIRLKLVDHTDSGSLFGMRFGK